jgi:hypothetical protein
MKNLTLFSSKKKLNKKPYYECLENVMNFEHKKKEKIKKKKT